MSIREIVTTAWDAIMKTGIFIMILNYAVFRNWYKYKRYGKINRQVKMEFTRRNGWYIFVMIYGILACIYMYANWR